MKVIVVSGGFDPIHSGHIDYLRSAKNYGHKLIVALNSDSWLIKKKGKFLMPFEERKIVIESIRYVDEVLGFNDDKRGSCIDALNKIKSSHKGHEIYFANGGDRDKSNVPEMTVQGIKFIFGVGGSNKKNSSSWILKNWQHYKENRTWGKFYNLFKDDDVKVKELIISPGEGMSFQRHFKRSELWLVSKGSCVINYSSGSPNSRDSVTLRKFDNYHVKCNEWHQITNPFKEKCHIIEIQYGEDVVEDDIERADYYRPLNKNY